MLKLFNILLISHLEYFYSSLMPSNGSIPATRGKFTAAAAHILQLDQPLPTPFVLSD